VLRGIFGPKRDEAARVWRKLHKLEFHDWTRYTAQISVTRMKETTRKKKSCVDWVGQAQDRNKLRAVVNVVITFWF
jgi:hypothetical protein